MRAAGAALCALIAALVIAAPAPAASRKAVQAAAFEVPTPAVPARDVVIDQPTQAMARSAASASLVRYPVNDGAGRSVEITSDCPVTCDATPEEVAALLGTLAHGDEVNLLTVHLVPPEEIPFECGSPSAQACYFPTQNRIVINGDQLPGADGSPWEFVVAHEYGHHLANHRDNSPFDNPAVDWGPKYWASYERVCQGVRAGAYFPGDEYSHYFENPGEAFAEAFAFNRFPTAPVQWGWIASLQPDPGAYAAIQRDALIPWSGSVADKRRGHFRKKRRRPRKSVKRFDTSVDGDLTLRLSGPDRADLALKLSGPNGLLARSDAFGSQEQVSYTICGERGVTAVVRRHGSRKRVARFKLTALRP